MRCERDLEMETSDGVVLRADAYYPPSHSSATTPSPAILIRTPYSKGMDAALQFPEVKYLSARGFLVICQDCRGRHRSDGIWRPFEEARDTRESLLWVASFEACDGRVGMCGQSYMGGIQYQLLTGETETPSCLRACCVTSGIGDLSQVFAQRAGLTELNWTRSYAVWMAHHELVRRGQDAEAALSRYQKKPLGWRLPLALRFAEYWTGGGRPLFEASNEALCADSIPGAEWLSRVHELAAEFEGGDLAEGAMSSASHVKVLHIGGLYDGFQHSTLDMLGRLGGHIILGPWAHLVPFSSTAEQLKQSRHVLKHGEHRGKASYDLLEAQHRFFRRHLMEDHSEPLLPQVVHYVTGKGVWRELERFPDTTILSVPLGPEDAWELLHDPQNPVPTRGGAMIGTFGASATFSPGAQSQRDVWDHPNSLVFRLTELPEALCVCGNVRLHLEWETQHLGCVDFVAVLSDGGYLVAEGPICAPRGARVAEVDLWFASHQFQQHRDVVVSVSCSSWPRYNASPDRYSVTLVPSKCTLLLPSTP